METNNIYFKLKSALHYETLTFQGTRLQVGEVKEKIADALNMSAKDFDLVLSNSQTGMVYEEDAEYVSNNISLNVERKPLVDKWQRPNFMRQKEMKEMLKEHTEDITRVTQAAKMVQNTSTPLTVTDAVTEEEKMQLLRTDEEQKYQMTKVIGRAARTSRQTGYNVRDPSRVQNNNQNQGKAVDLVAPAFCHALNKPPPKDQPCSLCEECGHWPAHCPTKKLAPTRKLVPPRGVPAAMLEVCSADDPEAKYQHQNTGVVYKLRPNVEQFQNVMQTTGEVQKTGQDTKISGEDIPEDLLCPLCESLFIDAVLVSCCGESYCTGCLEDHLDKNDRGCPGCNAKVFSEGIVQAKMLRDMCKDFRVNFEAEQRKKQQQSLIDLQASKQRQREESEAVKRSTPSKPQLTTQPTAQDPAPEEANEPVPAPTPLPSSLFTPGTPLLSREEFIALQKKEMHKRALALQASMAPSQPVAPQPSNQDATLPTEESILQDAEALVSELHGDRWHKDRRKDTRDRRNDRHRDNRDRHARDKDRGERDRGGDRDRDRDRDRDHGRDFRGRGYNKPVRDREAGRDRDRDYDRGGRRGRSASEEGRRHKEHKDRKDKKDKKHKKEKKDKKDKSRKRRRTSDSGK